MESSKFSQYTTDYINGVMSLRKPQKVSLDILNDILKNVELKESDIDTALKKINTLYPTCTNFERDFISLTFALATGVGKTRLMGAFIAYLYTNYNIKNFLVIAPGTTVYEKLKKDLGDSSNPKYVFKGMDCFSKEPKVIADDDYKEKNISFFDSDVNIYVFNIGKLDKENTKIRDFNENLGKSFFKKMADFNDLVMIMDESHHYRAERGMATLNELNPILGLELTATPIVKINSKQEFFKNVVYEYPLSKAIEDGYTRTPYAVTRSNINFYNFGDDQLDRLMLEDGILCHENIKNKLIEYAKNNNREIVKPFMLVVCKDTEHANLIEKFVKSDEFKEGKYRNKTIVVHSKARGAETDANMKLLLEVERNDNPVEIVIHVNMLKEGWDVNNLYTIVPLRTATSKILREQMVGRGLRLPYGNRTGEKEIDSVMLTAHDKFNDILKEAQKGDSIFKAGNIIKAEELEDDKIEFTQLSIDLNSENEINNIYEETNMERNILSDMLLKEINSLLKEEVSGHICSDKNKDSVSEKSKSEIVNKVAKRIESNKDLGKIFKQNECPISTWMLDKIEKIHREAANKFIPIPSIKITDEGVEEYKFIDFDLDISKFKQKPIDNELLIQSLEDMSDRQCIKGKYINFEGYNAKKILLNLILEKPEIDYNKCSSLLFKLITQVCNHYENMSGEEGMKNIVMMCKREISNSIYEQMMQHFYYEKGFIKEEVIPSRKYNLSQAYNYKQRKNLYESYEGNIQSILFDGIKRGVFNVAKFDSNPELILARVLERESEFVLNWLRPAPSEFNITYNRGHKYEPDFVVETDDIIYLVEVKREDQANQPDVVAKKNRAIKYCQVVTEWGKANGYKEWKHIFIPSKQINENSSFKQLCKQFVEEGIQ